MISAYRDNDRVNTSDEATARSLPLDWAWLLARAHGDEVPDTPPPDTSLTRRFLPVVEAPIPSDRPLVVAHLAQSIDGRIALPDGESQWITGDADLTHTHQLRALCDAVMVGANTVACDNPRLTVRRVQGPHPLRVVLDPHARLGAEHTVYADDHRTLRVCGPGAPPLDGVDDLAMDAQIDVVTLLSSLRARGVRRLFVEGGGVTLAHLLSAGVVDRLHMVIAPLLVGAGRASVSGMLGASLADCPRPVVDVQPLGDDWLFDCAFPG